MTAHKYTSPKHSPRHEGADGENSPLQQDTGGIFTKDQPVIKTLPLDSIIVDEGLQCRASVDNDTVADYVERMKAGDKFPPLVAFEDDGACLLVDGRHRHAAALKAGLTEFPVEIHQGSRDDALRYALQANATHGLPRTNRDKRRAVELALREFGEASNRVIAEMCRVSHVFVAKVRPQLETVTSSATRLGRDGRMRKLPRKPFSGDPKTREESTSRSGEGDSQAKAARGAQSKDNGQGRTAARRTEQSSGSSSFWDEWSAIEDCLNAALKKWPDGRWRRELASRLCKFADLRCL